MRNLLLYGWLVWLLLGGTRPARAQGQWLPGFHPPGLNGRVAAVVVQPNGDLIAGGEFTNAGGHAAADYVARWDGRRWLPLGEGPGRFTYLTALQPLPNGHLLAAGMVMLDSAKVRSMVLRWDGHHWQPLGAALPDIWLHTLAVGPTGEVLAGFGCCRGSLPGQAWGVLRWNGHTWQPLAPNPPADSTGSVPFCRINHLVITPGGDIVATGIFPQGPYQTNVAARWTGTGWQLLGPPAEGHRSAEALALTPTGEVVTGGILYDNHSHWTNYVARWDGRAWQPLGTALPGRVARLVAGPAGTVLATVRLLDRYGALVATTTERWDGSRWQPMTPTGANREALAVAGRGSIIGSGPVGLARWDGRRWHELTGPPTAGFAQVGGSQVAALAVGRGREVFLAGQLFTDAPAQPGHYQYRTQVLRWNGHRRRVLGPDFRGAVAALAVAPNGDLLAAGDFRVPGTGADSIRYLARWDGRRWQGLGEGLPGAAHALAVAANGAIWAGGNFGLRRWDGRRWQPLPLPQPSPADSNYFRYNSSYVRALALAPNGDLLAGGNFPGSTSYNDAHVIRWNGQRWQLLEGSVEVFVNSIAVGARGHIAVGSGATGVVHEFSSDHGGVVRSDTVGFNVNGWAYPPMQCNGYVYAVAVAPNGDVFAGGSFYRVNQKPISYLARWHDGAWQPLSSAGLDGPVRALGLAPNGDLVVGGEFSGAGPQPLGRWGIFRAP